MDEKFVLLKTYTNGFEADLAKGLLEESGIQVELKNALFNSIYPTFAGDMFKLELCVPSEEAETAEQILGAYTDGFYTHKLLAESGALLEGHFQLTSGRHSSRYIEKIRILQHPEQTSELCRLLNERLSEFDFEAVVGPAFGGIALAYEVARQMHKSFLFTQRIEEKMSIRSGFDLENIKNVVIIEDIVTTGGSVIEVMDCLKSKDVTITAIGAIADRSGGNVDFGCPFISLLTIDVPSYDPSDCELCKAEIPLTKPGSSDKK